MKCSYYIKIFIVSLMAGLIFFGVAYFYLSGITDKEKSADKSESGITYSYIPENVDIVFNYKDKACLLTFDFDNKKVTADFIKGKSGAKHTVNADSDCLAGIVDRLGGIDIITDGAETRLTGVQAVNMLDLHNSRTEIRNITEAIFEKIYKNGFSNDDFAFIIEGRYTDITLPECYYWQDYIKEIFENYEVII